MSGKGGCRSLRGGRLNERDGNKLCVHGTVSRVSQLEPLGMNCIGVKLSLQS